MSWPPERETEQESLADVDYDMSRLWRVGVWPAVTSRPGVWVYTTCGAWVAEEGKERNDEGLSPSLTTFGTAKPTGPGQSQRQPAIVPSNK